MNLAMNFIYVHDATDQFILEVKMMQYKLIVSMPAPFKRNIYACIN